MCVCVLRVVYLKHGPGSQEFFFPHPGELPALLSLHVEIIAFLKNVVQCHEGPSAEPLGPLR